MREAKGAWSSALFVDTSARGAPILKNVWSEGETRVTL